MQSITQEVGARVRAFRQRMGITQEELAERAELHHTYIGQVERGEKNLTIASLEKILTALNVSFSDFFEKIEERKDDESIPMRCYNLIKTKKEPEQLRLFHILEEIDSLIHEEE